MMRPSFFIPCLTALTLHGLGLAGLSLCWDTWRGMVPPLPLSPPMLIAVTPVSEPALPPALPPEPETSPEPASLPMADTAPEPLPAAPTLQLPVPPPAPVAPAPPQHLTPPSKPIPRPRNAQMIPAKPVSKHQNPAHTASSASASTQLGEAGSGAPGASADAPSPEAAQRPNSAGTDAGNLFVRGDMLVAPGTGSSGGLGPGGASTGSNDGMLSAGMRVGASGGTGSGAGSGRGSTGAGTGSGSARPIGGYQVKPHYPESARRRGIEGTTLLKMRSTAQGQVEDVQVECSAGHHDLDQSALEAVRRWRFEPARRGSEPVAVWVVIPVEFKLQ